MTIEEAARSPEKLPFALAEHERGRSCDELWEEAIRELREAVERDGEGAWEEIVGEYDQYSLYEFLQLRGWSEGAIEYYTVMNFLEADLHNACLEVLREDIGGAYVDMREIVGGIDRLPNAFFDRLQDRVRLGTEVHALDQGLDAVTVHYRTEAGRFAAVGDYAIVTIPFSVLRTVERSRRSRTGSSARSASSTTRPRRRSSSRCGTASGRQRTGSTAAAP